MGDHPWIDLLDSTHLGSEKEAASSLEGCRYNGRNVAGDCESGFRHLPVVWRSDQTLLGDLPPGLGGCNLWDSDPYRLHDSTWNLKKPILSF